jgi:hypothetical protein
VGSWGLELSMERAEENSDGGCYAVLEKRGFSNLPEAARQQGNLPEIRLRRRLDEENAPGCL